MKNRSTIYRFNLYGCLNIHRMFICSCCTYVNIMHLFLLDSRSKRSSESFQKLLGAYVYVMIYVSPTQNKPCLVISSNRNDHIKTKYDITHGQHELKKTTS